MKGWHSGPGAQAAPDSTPGGMSSTRRSQRPAAHAGPYLEAGRVLAEGLELGGHVAGPEPDVVDAKLDHGQSLQAQAECPGAVPLPAVGIQYLLLYHPAGMRRLGDMLCLSAVEQSW